MASISFARDGLETRQNLINQNSPLFLTYDIETHNYFFWIERFFIAKNPWNCKKIPFQWNNYEASTQQKIIQNYYEL